MNDPLELLARSDKHYLGSGDSLIFAPRFPRWLGVPGFWDEVDVFHYQLAPLFTVTFVEGLGDEPGRGEPKGVVRALPCRQLDRRWTPAEIVAGYELGAGLTAREHRSALPDGHFLSEWSVGNRADHPVSLLAVAWTLQPTEGLDLESVAAEPGRASLRRVLCDRHGEELSVAIRLGVEPRGLIGSAYLSEPASSDPDWELTPFPEKWRDGQWTAVQVGGVSGRGVVYAAVAAPVEVAARDEARVRLLARIEPEIGRVQPAGGPHAAEIRRHTPPPERRSAVRLSEEAEPGAISRARWRAFFGAVPALACSDPYIERYWYYRWYGLRLCSHEGGTGHHLYPGCCEGTGYFHVPIAYSGQCHVRELRWLRDPARARGVILNFLAHQKSSGQLHGRIYVNHLEGTDFYFADWGEAVLAVDAVHPDAGFLRAVYGPLAAYAAWLVRERDADSTGLIDVIDHYETGQEYMSRYMAVSREADGETWGDRIRLKGIDATVYAYNLQRSLDIIARRVGDSREAGRWRAQADRTAEALRSLAWDPVIGMFSDVAPGDLRRTGVKAAVCFYPYLTDVVDASHVKGLKRHLFDPEEFWAPYPVPSTAMDDPFFSPDAEWKGKRHNCPWNGRVWPMTNSHVTEALARAAIEHDAGLRPRVAELLHRYLRMLFHEGDPRRPSCFEHYNPETGRPSLYRGFDDYQHSWVNDLVVKYVAGFRPLEAGGAVVDPFPLGLDYLTLQGLPFRGHTLDIEIDGEDVRVRIDGATFGDTRIGEPLRIEPS